MSMNRLAVVAVLALMLFLPVGIPRVSAAPAAANVPTTAVVTVQAGESLGYISVLYGVSMSAIEKANNISSSYDVYPGIKLTIPLSKQIESGYTIGRYYGMVNPF